MVALPGLCGFFGLWCLHFWVWWVDIWCWWAVGWSWDGLWVVVAVSSLCHVHLLAFPARQVQQVQQVANLKPSKVLHRLEMSPYSAQTSNLSSVNIYQWWWRYFKIYRILWGFNSEGGGPDSSRRRTWRFCGNSAQACDLNMRSSHFKTTKVNGTVSKMWWRFGKYATLCQVTGDKTCQVVMVVVGCSFLCLLAVLGPSLGFPSLNWFPLVLGVSVDQSGVPVLTGHSLCK